MPVKTLDPHLRQMVRGLFGCKTGCGFLDYIR